MDLERAERFAPLVERWLERAGRDFPWRHWRDEYRLTVAEILLQRTRADVVERFVDRFFAVYNDWPGLARADVASVAVLLQPIGLHQRRASSLVALARQRVEHPTAPLAGLPGVGQYVQRAVAVGMTGAPLAMVDANFVRIIDRVFGGPWMSDYRYDRRLQGIAQAVISGARDARHANWAVLDLGATTCLPRGPRCGECPLASLCRWASGITPAV